MAFFTLISGGNTSPRRGRVSTSHGTFETPAFMPVGTQATVKGIYPDRLKELGAEIILNNTYHLHLRPGEAIVREVGGSHKFMNWDRPILTDSGGFQVFSLSGIRKIREEGVDFRSHLSGARMFMSPEDSIHIQEALGSDIAMSFDVCSAYPCEHDEARDAMERTHRWAKRGKEAHTLSTQSLFGIVQGAFEADLRRESARTLADMDFPGFGIGGLSVGEPKQTMYDMLDIVNAELPTDKPRYLMGVGSPDCLVEGVARGVDMFDCVLPTRVARNGSVFTSEGRLTIRNAEYARDFRPVDERCDCYLCRNFTRAYLRHLFKAGEMLGAMLATEHNLRYLLRLMIDVRASIENGTFEALRRKVREVY